ncbi:hypothetical protein LTR84_010676 [Exophiala bonariae]|uniref:Uncharacterized protein n=1 Tax=Exophiala bonariae TaxID=1690606 RepID=A0AAV9MSG7_9EURO|nr:hypothetical protein LTR84_010676 [Exophiala bonariae]
MLPGKRFSTRGLVTPSSKVDRILSHDSVTTIPDRDMNEVSCNPTPSDFKKTSAPMNILQHINPQQNHDYETPEYGGRLFWTSETSGSSPDSLLMNSGDSSNSSPTPAPLEDQTQSETFEHLLNAFLITEVERDLIAGLLGAKAPQPADERLTLTGKRSDDHTQLELDLGADTFLRYESALYCNQWIDHPGLN